MFAGSETTWVCYIRPWKPTTVTEIRSIVTALSPHSSNASSELQQEINMHFPITGSDHRLGEIYFYEVGRLRYLNACMKESRIRPPFDSMYKRIFRPAGAIICGQIVPGSTIFRCNLWILQRKKAFFWRWCQYCRPERWLEEREMVKGCNVHIFQFGGGNHVCSGRNISILEISKLIAALIRKFEVCSPGQWFVRSKLM